MYGSLNEKILRVGLAFTFVYPAVSAWFNSYAWIGYFPSFVLDIVGTYDIVFLHIFGITEIIIAIWLVFGKRIFWPALIAAGYLLAIILFNLNQFDVTFRDVGLLAMAGALVWNHAR
ncbi:hypothetical protein COB18_00890 [Candidatus Kaiserbacteria bacterium]|nr:MAG: hypothetical protein COB18_00890 [Candidatus Kaiserbacteria bacterium]